MIIAANFNFSKMFIVDLASGEILVNKAPQLPLQFVSAAPADSTGEQRGRNMVVAAIACSGSVRKDTEMPGLFAFRDSCL